MLLKKTDTIVTQPDGKVYKEHKGSQVHYVGQSSGFVVDTKPDNIPAKVIENLYLGSQDCCDLNVLSEFQIKAVLSVGIDTPIKYDTITYTFADCLDLPETDISKVVTQCFRFIDSHVNAKNNVLVHCNAGVSRSASVVIGFLMLKNDLGYSEAFEICKSARSCVKPNAGFEKQLKLLKKQLTAFSAAQHP